MTDSRGRDIHFDVAGRVIAAQEWGDAKGRPVLALHGWLDNSASFLPLAQLLTGVHLIALDMPGHGHSSHVAEGLAYNIWSDISDIFAVADSLGWEKFNLVGHSRGAIISALAAGTFPDRINSLTMIDALAPMPMASEEAPEQLAKSILGVRQRQDKKTSLFTDIDAAVEAREKGMHKISSEAARMIVERGVKPVAGGYTWSSDPRLMAPSALKLSKGQIKAFFSRISVPVVVVAAETGLVKWIEKQAGVLEYFSSHEFIKLSGGHFLHMEHEAATIAELIQNRL